MKNPYIAGLYSHVPGADEFTTEQLLAQSGRNFGNFIFSASVRRFVKTTTQTNKLTVDPNVVAKECDGIVIPAANWLQRRNDFSDLARRIEKADVNTVILGLGAQAASGGGIPELQEGMLRFLKAVSDRCVSMSVRGAFSAEVLNHYGIKNVTVTGCPSLLWHMDQSASVNRVSVMAHPIRVATSVTLPNMADAPKANDHRMELSRLILNESLKNSYAHVPQTEIELIRASRGELDEGDQGWSYLSRAFNDDRREIIAGYTSRLVRAFTNVPEWLAYLSNRDFVIGTRLHGTIAALLAGTPAMLITHDARTEELARFAAIPSVSAEQLLRDGTIDCEALVQKADFGAFNMRQIEYFRDFREFLDLNSVPHRLAKI